MTFAKWFKLYRHWQNVHDIKVKGITYEELRKKQAETAEWF